MTGSVLAGLVGAYVAAINQGAVPTIATAWQVCSRGPPLLHLLAALGLPNNQTSK